MVTVRFFAAAAQLAGTREVRGEWSGLTAGQLIERLRVQFPRLEQLGDTLMVAVNQEFAAPDRQVADGDEVALLPPVSGGEEPLFAVVSAPLSADAIARKVVDPMVGAVDIFVGTVREWTRGHQTIYLEYEAYPEMAVRTLEQIGREIAERWPGARTAIHHRVGKLHIGEASVVIAVATAHRADSFEGCRYAIERLKRIVPIWKKEVWAGGETWVGAQTHFPGEPPA